MSNARARATDHLDSVVVAALLLVDVLAVQNRTDGTDAVDVLELVLGPAQELDGFPGRGHDVGQLLVAQPGRPRRHI